MVLFKDIITLVGYTFTKDDLGQRIEVPTNTDVYANKKSINQSEFFQTANSGIKAEHVFVIRTIDYNKQQNIRYNGAVLDIYRTFERGEYIELYVRSKLGVK